MGEKWDDARDGHIADYVHEVCRSMASFQREADEILAPTPSQRAELSRQAEADAAKPQPHVTLEAGDGMLRMINAQAARIAQQDETIDQLHVANKHLAGRIDKLTQAVADEHIICAEQDTAILQRLSKVTQLTDKGFKSVGAFEDYAQTMLNQLCAQAKRVRIRWPSVGEPTIQEQCDESWMQEDSAAFYEGARQMSDAQAEEGDGGK